MFDVQVTVHRDKVLIIKPTRCTNFRIMDTHYGRGKSIRNI